MPIGCVEKKRVPKSLDRVGKLKKYFTMKKLKLNMMASENLSKVEMNQVRGGKACGCGCAGSSSSYDNGNANNEKGLYSPGVPNEWVISPN